MEMKDDEFQALRLKVDQISSELDKQNTVRVVNTKWMLIVGAVILSALGFTNFVKIPSEVDKNVPIAVKEEVEKAINEKTGTRIIAEAIDIRNELLGIKADALESKDKLVKITNNVKKEDFVNLPIGTIIPSMLDQESFAETVADFSGFDPEKNKWVLADGTNDLTNSKYYKLTGNKHTPDLRGMFLRGVNEGRSDGEQDPDERRVGVYQKDALQEHSHVTTAYKEKWYEDNDKDLGYATKGNANVVTASVDDVTGKEVNVADETRPKNVAVYFYIKIN